MKYKLLAADIDGTLLNPDSQLTPRTQKAVTRLLDKGALFVVSTGRPLRGISWLCQRFPRDLPCITYNGAVVIMSHSGRVLHHQVLSPAHGQEVAALGQTHNTAVFAWADDILYSLGNHDKNELYKQVSGITPVFADNIDKVLEKGADKLLWCDDIDKITRLQTQMQAHFQGKLICHTSNPHFLEFVHLHVSKARAMESIGRIYGITAEEMIAVGDGFNDVSMLQYAGLGVAMDNAPDAVKQTANLVTASNSQDGVARIIEQYFLEESQ